MTDFRPRRSVLYLPAANASAIENARGLAADVVILDLEDAVAPAAKDEARDAALNALADGGWGRREMLVRVNGLSTQWSQNDFAAFRASGADGLVVPKVDGPDDAAQAVALAGDKPVWAMIETPRAVLQADAVATTPGIAALIAGFADLTNDLRARPKADRLPLIFSASRILLAARMAGIPAFDGIYTDIRDPDGFNAEAQQGLELGFDGKTCIHPTQIEAVNRIFSPSEPEIENARGLIAAHEAALAEGKGVATFNGKLVEVLHVADARRTLSVAEKIAGVTD